MDNIKDKGLEWVLSYGPKVLAAILILILGRLAAGLIRVLINKVMKKSKVDQTLINFVSSVTYVAVMAFVVVAALGQLGIQTASFVAILGAAGLAIGLALQGSLANFASGVLMIIFRPFRIGDTIKGGGTEGIVETVNIFSTELMTPDNKKIIIPNSKLTADIIVNYSAKDQRRIEIILGVNYTENLDKVRKALQAILDAENRVLSEPAPAITIQELASNKVNFAIMPWVKTTDYGDVYHSLLENIKKTFDAEEITIVFP